MAAKKVKTQIKMLIKAGSANPAPPVGSTLGPQGVNLMQFCKEFNDRTSGMQGMVPAVVTIYDDRSFEFELKVAPVSELVKQKAKIQKGGSHQLKDKVAVLSMDDVRAIAEQKMPDLNAYSIESAMQQVIGTCKSMAVKIEG